jgi:hypothetical protein
VSRYYAVKFLERIPRKALEGVLLECPQDSFVTAGGLIHFSAFEVA